jgi:hypothetical protein
MDDDIKPGLPYELTREKLNNGWERLVWTDGVFWLKGNKPYVVQFPFVRGYFVCKLHGCYQWLMEIDRPFPTLGGALAAASVMPDGDYSEEDDDE